MPKLTTRDYKRSSRASSAKLKEFGLGVVVGAVLASAAFLMAGAHARHHAAVSSRPRPGTDSQSTAPRAPAADDTSSDGPDSTAPASSASSPKYDFYRMLPRFKVPVTRDDDHAEHIAPPPAVGPAENTAAAGPSYVLQVGSYRSTAEADQVRDHLARVGITAQIQRIVEGSSTWNRVRIGPLSEAGLSRVREQLRIANIHALTIRADR